MTFATFSRGMPGAIGSECGAPALRIPLTRTSSKVPWYAPAKRTILLRAVTVRATRIAAMTASEPVLQKVARSIPGQLADQCGDFAGERRLRTDLEPVLELLRDGLRDEVRSMPEHDRAEAVQDVDILVAVEVPEPGALRPRR